METVTITIDPKHIERYKEQSAEKINSGSNCDYDLALIETIMDNGDMFTSKSDDRIVATLYNGKTGILTLCFDDRDDLYRVPLWYRNCVDKPEMFARLIDNPIKVDLVFLRTERPTGE